MVELVLIRDESSEINGVRYTASPYGERSESAAGREHSKYLIGIEMLIHRLPSMM